MKNVQVLLNNIYVLWNRLFLSQFKWFHRDKYNLIWKTLSHFHRIGCYSQLYFSLLDFFPSFSPLFCYFMILKALLEIRIDGNWYVSIWSEPGSEKKFMLSLFRNSFGIRNQTKVIFFLSCSYFFRYRICSFFMDFSKNLMHNIYL